MPIGYTQELSETDIDDANTALSAYFLNIGERDKLANLYGVGRRTVERWFAPLAQQRRNCIPKGDTIRGGEGALEKRLCKMSDTKRLEYLRLRCCLPFGLAVLGGITRDAFFTGDDKVSLVECPSLAIAVSRLDMVLGNTWGNEYIWYGWTAVYIDEVTNPLNPWLLVIEYKYPNDRDEFYRSEGEPIPGDEIEPGPSENYDEYDPGSETSYVWEPE